jgi:fumarylacetoacetase
MAGVNETHDPARRSWVKAANEIGCDFPIQNLPFGIFRAPGRHPRGGVANPCGQKIKTAGKTRGYPIPA